MTQEPRRPLPDEPPRALRGTLESFAGDLARALSRRTRVRIGVSLAAMHSGRVDDLASRLGAFDCAVALELAPEGPMAYVFVPRMLAFLLLSLRFGGALDADPGAAPERPYTRIEARALERMAQELWTALAAAACGRLPAAPHIAGIDDAGDLRGRPDHPLWLASLVLRGAGPPVELFVAIPEIAWGDSGVTSDLPRGGSHEAEEARRMGPQGARAPGGRTHDPQVPPAAPGLTAPPPPDLHPARGASGARAGRSEDSRAG